MSSIIWLKFKCRMCNWADLGQLGHLWAKVKPNFYWSGFQSMCCHAPVCFALLEKEPKITRSSTQMQSNVDYMQYLHVCVLTSAKGFCSHLRASPHRARLSVTDIVSRCQKPKEPKPLSTEGKWSYCICIQGVKGDGKSIRCDRPQLQKFQTCWKMGNFWLYSRYELHRMSPVRLEPSIRQFIQ